MKILFLLALLFSYSSAQDELSAQYDYAKELYSKENYFDAVTEFKRLLFFDREEKYSYQANIYIGKCYKYGGRFSDAVRYFAFAEIAAESYDDIYKARIENVKANILRRTTDRALQLLNELMEEEYYQKYSSDIIYWKGWANILADDWEKAEKEFSSINNYELKELSSKTEDEQYSLSLVKAMSIVVPGSGQIYMGEYLSGFLSLGWNLLFGYLTINSFVENRIFDGLAIGNFLWLRFYLGSLYNVEAIAKEKNGLASNKALEYLQNKFSGLKPSD